MSEDHARTVAGTNISAVICTLDRASHLCNAVRSLINQTLPQHQYEILVVDNGSSDTTRDKIEELALSEPAQIRYIPEGRLGLAHARNTGALHSKGTWIAYLDDDALASPNWLEAILRTCECSADIGCVGGPIVPLWEVSPPDWLGAELLSYLSLLEIAGAEDVMALSFPRHCLYGANMAFPRALLLQSGGFSTDLGRTGSNLLSAEEIELFYRLEAMGKRLYYTPAATVYHTIPASRLTKKFFRRRAYWGGRSVAVLHRKHLPFRDMVVHASQHLVRSLPIEVAQALVLRAVAREKESLVVECRARWRLGYSAEVLALACKRFYA